MQPAPRQLSEARVLLTNDDGIGAPGLVLLEELIAPLVKSLMVVAPENNQSGCGHTVAVARPLRLMKHNANHFAVNGTPPDAVLMGAREVMKDDPPNLVLSGINDGKNIAEYVHYSGTCAACYEAGLMGIPSVAFSQDSGGVAVNFDAARGWLVNVLTKLLAQPWPGDCFVNINFPACPSVQVQGAELTRLGRVLQGTGFAQVTDPRGRVHYWNDWRDDVLDAVDAAPGTDLAALSAGRVAITPVAIDQTDHQAMEQMRREYARA